MRSRRSGNDQVAEVARRRLELLSAELAELRRESGGPALPNRPAPDRLPDAPHVRHSDVSHVRHHDAPHVGHAEVSPVRQHDAPSVRHSFASRGRHAHRSVGAVGLVSGWLQDRLPASLQGRVQMSAAHVAVVALLAVAGVAVTGWLVSRSEGGGSVVPLTPSAASAPGAPVGAAPSGAPVAPLVTPSVTPGAAPVTPPTGAGDVGAVSPPAAPAAPGVVPPGADGVAQPATGTGTGRIVVDVTGKVRRPGIATLPVGSRVVDALEAAGGARRGARLGTLNLARLLVDGEQVVVGVPAPPGVAASAAVAPTAGASSPLVNINTASQSELEELPGVGPVTARSILDFRAENGAFTSVDELLEVSGIGDATLAELAPFVTL